MKYENAVIGDTLRYFRLKSNTSINAMLCLFESPVSEATWKRYERGTHALPLIQYRNFLDAMAISDKRFWNRVRKYEIGLKVRYWVK